MFLIGASIVLGAVLSPIYGQGFRDSTTAALCASGVGVMGLTQVQWNMVTPRLMTSPLDCMIQMSMAFGLLAAGIYWLADSADGYPIAYIAGAMWRGIGVALVGIVTLALIVGVALDRKDETSS